MGGIGSKYLPNEAIHLIYGIIAVLAVILMLIPNKGSYDEHTSDLPFNKVMAVGTAFVIGLVSGIVGAGGAFMLIPVLLTVLKIPTRTTIASSLAIVFISAIGGLAGKLGAGHIPIVPTVFTVMGSMIGAPLGSRLSARINVQVLRYGLVVLIAATATKIWISII